MFLPRCRQVALLGLSLVPVAARAQYEKVDPILGTARDGQTVPAVGMPFAMTTWTPETRATEAKCIAPYYYTDGQITGFRGSHFMSGSCGFEYGGLTLMPTTGTESAMPEVRSSKFSHESEIAQPAYYAVTLKRYGVRVEMTGTTRAGFLRIHYPPGDQANLVLDSDTGEGGSTIVVDRKRASVVASNAVVRNYAGAHQPAGFSGNFLVQVQGGVKGFSYWCGAEFSPAPFPAGKACSRRGVLLRVTPSATGEVLVKMGSSMTGTGGAKDNLKAEIPTWAFDETRVATENVWRERIGKIEVQGGTAGQQVAFYTALYHASLCPRIVSDVDGSYNGFAQQGKLHRVTHGDAYDDYSLWDTYRALHPLLTIIDPERDQAMIRSLIAKGEEGGFLPIFPIWNSYTTEMIGDHVGSLVVDAYAKGLRDFDVDAAYRLMLKNADITPPLDVYRNGLGRRGLTSYLRFGYIPLEDEVQDAFHHHEQVSRTLEYAYDDFALGRLARMRGDASVAERMEKRAQNWRNVFDARVGFVRGRHADGSWIEPFDPSAAQSYITESTPWQYTFYVPQDVPGLIQASGGTGPFITRLDGVFENHRYDPGNEPGHQIAYLYDYAGAAWKTQARVRSLLTENYGTGPSGLPGNEDGGQMSAWYLFGALGFYPVCPGMPEYALGTPLFDRVVLHLAGGRTFQIVAHDNSAQNFYVSRVRINGQAAKDFRLQHAVVASGGTLTFDMSPQPSK